MNLPPLGGGRDPRGPSAPGARRGSLEHSHLSMGFSALIALLTLAHKNEAGAWAALRASGQGGAVPVPLVNEKGPPVGKHWKAKEKKREPPNRLNSSSVDHSTEPPSYLSIVFQTPPISISTVTMLS